MGPHWRIRCGLHAGVSRWVEKCRSREIWPQEGIMNFTVDWDTGAEDELTALWLAAPDQRAMAAASATIDHLLATDPFGFGQYLSEGLWRLRVPPLVVHYTVDLVRRHVQVTDV